MDLTSDSGPTTIFAGIDMYTNPSCVPNVKKEITKLQDNIALVEGFIHARDRLLQASRLQTDTLSKCGVIVAYVDSAPPDDNLSTELCLLTFDELAFSSICFSERQLKRVRNTFKASLVQTFMKAQNISCLRRLEVFTRLNYVLAKSPGTRFRGLFLFAQAQNTVPPILYPSVVYADLFGGHHASREQQPSTDLAISPSTSTTTLEGREDNFFSSSRIIYPSSEDASSFFTIRDANDFGNLTDANSIVENGTGTNSMHIGNDMTELLLSYPALSPSSQLTFPFRQFTNNN